MNTKIKLLLSAFVLMVGMAAFSVAAFPSNSVIAQAPPSGGPQGGLDGISGAYPDGATRDADVPAIAKRVIEWALYLSAVVAILFVIYGGFLYITSGGDATQAGKGKSTLVNAIIGLTIVVLSFMIVQVVYNFLVS